MTRTVAAEPPKAIRGLINVVIADHHRLFADTLGDALQTSLRLRVASRVGTGFEAVELCARLRPEVLILDPRIPGPAIDQVIAGVKRNARDTAILMLAGDIGSLSPRSLLDAGATRFLVKSISMAELLQALYRLPVRPREDVAEAAAPAIPGRGLGARSYPRALTDREIDVLTLMSESLSNHEIAGRLGIRENTVKNHVHSLLSKLGARNRIDAIRRGADQGILRRIDDR